MKKTASPLPPEFVAWLKGYVQSKQFTNVRRMHRGLVFRWCLWRDGIQANALPGYAECPPESHNGLPAGWSLRTFSDIAREAIGTDTIRRARARAAGISR